jgi:hypothetical protein
MQTPRFLWQIVRDIGTLSNADKVNALHRAPATAPASFSALSGANRRVSS